MPYVNNFISIIEYMFALYFLHTIEELFGKKTYHNMIELGMLSVTMKSVLKNSASTLNHITVDYMYLHFELIPKPKSNDTFKNKP